MISLINFLISSSDQAHASLVQATALFRLTLLIDPTKEKHLFVKSSRVGYQRTDRHVLINYS